MSSYHTSFTYLSKNSYDDFNLQIVHFESGDTGETESYLSQEAIYQDSVRGTRRTMYGSKYNSVAILNITVMRPDGAEFSIEKTRQINKWLTGATQYSWMDLYVGDEIKYRMHGFVQDVKPYKIDSRIVGFVIVVESSSPWCYSGIQQVSKEISGSESLYIDNQSDDLYTHTEMRTVFQNGNGQSLLIENNTIGETTEINNLLANEVITMSENMFITSDKITRIFGNDFNYVWPKLKPGMNDFTISGTGTITFEYIYPMKVTDCVCDLNAASGPVCDDDGKIILDQLSWNRISDKPSSIAGYGIEDAYTKTEINTLLENFTQADVYTKDEIDEKFDNINIDTYTKDEIDEKFGNINIPNIDTYTKDEIDEKFDNIDIPSIDAYTKAEIDAKLDNITASGVDIDEEQLNAMLAEVLV